ncbi:hypothetical protein RND81_02G233100 [Saponaria officinalis]|uniref:F-box protein SKIP14 n=1 Tax=Saponaria officinalis TaxID=3572 RepID=A0AAW1MZS6_SAPOF
MALNYSHRLIFPAHMPEDNNVVHGCSQEDIHDILPDDPFGMDICSTVTAITGWLEDLGVSEYGGYRGDEGHVGSNGRNPIFEGLNFLWDTAAGDFQPYPVQNKTSDMMYRLGRFDGFVTGEALWRFHDERCICYDFCTMEDVLFGCGDACSRGIKNAPSHEYRDNSLDAFVMKKELGYYFGVNDVSYGYGTMKDVMFGCDYTSPREEVNQKVSGVVDEMDNGPPHPGLSFALGHFGVRDLLVVERVCKSLQFTVQNDPLIWRSIHIDHPLNARITDDALVRLCSRAQGLLQCLSLVDCKLITNDGLRRVLESNLRLTKLSVPRCKNLKFAGILDCLKDFQSRAVTGIKCLRVAGLTITAEQFQELMLILGIRNYLQPDHEKPYFLCRGTIVTSCEDDRSVDLEICPKCKLVKLVYDCTTESCQGKEHAAHLCRACIQCINRCYQCGRCIDSVVHEEDFFLDYVCLDCSREILKGRDVNDIGSSSSSLVSLEIDG